MIDEDLFQISENKRIIQLLFDDWKNRIEESYKNRQALARQYGRDDSIYVCPKFEIQYIVDCGFEYAVFYRLWMNESLMVIPTVMVDVETMTVIKVTDVLGYLRRLPDMNAMHIIDTPLSGSTLPFFVNDDGAINTKPDFKKACHEIHG